jgi:hypothetical protein
VTTANGLPTAGAAKPFATVDTADNHDRNASLYNMITINSIVDAAQGTGAAAADQWMNRCSFCDLWFRSSSETFLL